MRLNEVQKHRLAVAHKEASDVLREMKQFHLSGKVLKDMKVLEEAVQALEICVMSSFGES